MMFDQRPLVRRIAANIMVDPGDHVQRCRSESLSETKARPYSFRKAPVDLAEQEGGI